MAGVTYITTRPLRGDREDWSTLFTAQDFTDPFALIMVNASTLALAALNVASMAAGHPTNLGARDTALPSSLPASASYNYLVPALYLNVSSEFHAAL